MSDEVLEYTEYKELKKVAFRKVAERLIEIKLEQEALEAERKTLVSEAGAMMTLADAKSVRFGDHTIVVTEGTTPGRFDRGKFVKLLTAKGVELRLIETCIQKSTGESKHWSTVQVRLGKLKDTSSEET